MINKDMIRQITSTVLGKSVRLMARLRGGGSALPGLMVEKIDKNFLTRTLSDLQHGTVLISGTNGKTTTTKIIVELLEGQGLKVFTNGTGSNFTRGVVAALLGKISWHGKLDADIAVLELDEAHATHFVKLVKPTHSLILNVMRDQLDRFGEIDHTAKLLETIAKAATKSVILNREDVRIRNIAGKLPSKMSVSYFGLSPELLATFPSDESLHDRATTAQSSIVADVELISLDNLQASFLFDETIHTTSLKLNGIYNTFNAAAALTTVRQVLKEKTNTLKLIASLSEVLPAFGRGETIMIDGQPLELVLVKNPSGFRLGLSSFAPEGYATMIAINDHYADGRDMSWLWDVSFDSLKSSGVSWVSGIRAYDMALRLYYDDVDFEHVDTDLASALTKFIDVHSNSPKRIYCTYTAMLTIRKQLKTHANLRGLKDQ